ncbi:hypothetical protein CRYUN_Cryun12cG0100400 [Craigia yunnanensis]
MNRMALCRLILLFFSLSFLVSSLDASEGLVWRSVRRVGAWGKGAFNTRNREKLGDKPVKYHGKCPFRRVYGIQEPVAVAFSALSLAIQFHGWLSFFILLNYKLPLRPNNRTYYEYTGLWHIYAILAMSLWFWSAVFHSRDVELTEKLDYSSAVALVGFGLILAILRAFDVRDEASRVVVAAPLIAFVTTHILYLNFYKLDYDLFAGLNMKVCMAIGVAQLLIWGVWIGVYGHPLRWKVWLFVVGGSLTVLLEIYDFPQYKGLLMFMLSGMLLVSLLLTFVGVL